MLMVSEKSWNIIVMMNKNAGEQGLPSLFVTNGKTSNKGRNCIIRRTLSQRNDKDIFHKLDREVILPTRKNSGVNIAILFSSGWKFDAKWKNIIIKKTLALKLCNFIINKIWWLCSAITLIKVKHYRRYKWNPSNLHNFMSHRLMFPSAVNSSCLHLSHHDV